MTVKSFVNTFFLLWCKVQVHLVDSKYGLVKLFNKITNSRSYTKNGLLLILFALFSIKSMTDRKTISIVDILVLLSGQQGKLPKYYNRMSINEKNFKQQRLDRGKERKHVLAIYFVELTNISILVISALLNKGKNYFTSNQHSILSCHH